MGFFSGVVKGILDVAVTPIAVVKDVVTLDTDMTSTKGKIKDIGDDIDEVLEKL